MSLVEKVWRNGLAGSVRIGAGMVWRQVRPYYDRCRFRNAPRYSNPTANDLTRIEQDLSSMGVGIEDYTPNPIEFKYFQSNQWFPPDYHGGAKSVVWDEKLLEHWISADRLGLATYGVDDLYVDMAASSSPWVKVLRERYGLQAFALDLNPVSDAYRDLHFYRREDATRTSFPNASVRGVSLHCAYEMFMGDDDTQLMAELARILTPGGKAVILPLYMHTHYCAYATPEYFGKGCSDPAAKEYIRMDCYGVPSSRKYDARRLKSRVLDPLERAGLGFRLLAIRNKESLGRDIYCHFILEINK
ncbi:methyltransferase domain-containing protein [Methylotetracoccus oryzae]|uniref:methyltransferase domain-containing protein n=1 Tax=Methylotetracoccus oryzae TaxID=1919059 RepID=UPI0013A5A3AE|nr:methyltransferase domain-containing protein [Methylotetracoccus oryzae]